MLTAEQEHLKDLEQLLEAASKLAKAYADENAFLCNRNMMLERELIEVRSHPATRDPIAWLRATLTAFDKANQSEVGIRIVEWMKAEKEKAP